MRGSPSFIFGKIAPAVAQVAGCILAFCLCATIALASPPAKPKNPGPLDIPDSQVLKMSIDQYIGAYEKKHNGDIREFEERALCYYYAELSRDRNVRLARHLSLSRRRLVTRCQAAFDSLSQTCFDYQYSTLGGTILDDFYASLEVKNEDVMHSLVNDLRGVHRSNRRACHDANDSYFNAWKAVRKSRAFLDGPDFPYGTTPRERIAKYHLVERALRRAKAVLNSLPDNTKPDFVDQLKEITDVLNAEY